MDTQQLHHRQYLPSHPNKTLNLLNCIHPHCLVRKHPDPLPMNPTLLDPWSKTARIRLALRVAGFEASPTRAPICHTDSELGVEKTNLHVTMLLTVDGRTENACIAKAPLAINVISPPPTRFRSDFQSISQLELLHTHRFGQLLLGI